MNLKVLFKLANKYQLFDKDLVVDIKILFFQ